VKEFKLKECCLFAIDQMSSSCMKLKLYRMMCFLSAVIMIDQSYQVLEQCLSNMYRWILLCTMSVLFVYTCIFVSSMANELLWRCCCSFVCRF